MMMVHVGQALVLSTLAVTGWRCRERLEIAVTGRRCRERLEIAVLVLLSGARCLSVGAVRVGAVSAGAVRAGAVRVGAVIGRM